MSDFFADLRRDLMEAAQRDARTPWLRRLRVPWRPVFAVAGAAAAAAFVLTAAATLSTDSERDVGPAAATVGPAASAGCAVHDAVPEEVLGSFGVFRRPRTDADEYGNGLNSGGMVLHVNHSRRAKPIAGGAVYLIPSVDCAKGTAGICLATLREGGGGLTCDPVKDTMLGTAMVEDDRYLLKAVPDHVERVRYTDGTTTATVDAENNVFVAAIPRSFDAKKLVLKFQLAGKDGFELAPAGVERADEPSEKGTNRSVEPAKEPGAQECGAPPPPRQAETSGAVPRSLSSAFGVLRLPAPHEPLPEVVKRPTQQTVRFYEDGVRLARSAGPWSIRVGAAEIIPRSAIKISRGCKQPPPTDGEPGLCLHVIQEDDQGALSACFLPAEVTAGAAFIDTAKLSAREGTIVGLAPDGARAAVVELDGHTTELDIENNVFAGSIGAKPSRAPQARITFK